MSDNRYPYWGDPCGPPDPCRPKPPCPPGPPPGHCGPPPQIPPFKPIPGESHMETMQRFWDLLQKTLGQAWCVDKTLSQIYEEVNRSSLKNGAYYSRKTIKTDDGYSSEDSAPYKMTIVKRVDEFKQPVRFDLYPAYGNTTNSQIKQDPFVASEMNLSNILVPACNSNEGGWKGKVIFKGAPLPTADENAGYTYGFTKRGTLKFYKSSDTSYEKMCRDTIENAMGCDGVIVNQGEVATGELISGISDYDTPTARVIIGQNYKSGDTFFLTVGDYEEDHPGMLARNCAEILVGYGCDVAVQVSSGEYAVGLERGGTLFVPDGANMPEAYAFISIAKKAYFRNEIQYSLAWLEQMYNRLKWEAYLQNVSINDLWAALRKEIADRIAGDQALQDQIDGIVTDVDDLRTKLEQEIADRIAEVERLDGKIDSLKVELDEEVARLDDKIDSVNEKLDQEIADRIAEIARLEALISTNKSDIDQIKQDLLLIQQTVQNHYNHWELITSGLRDDITSLESRQTALESQMNSLDAALTKFIDTIADVEVALNEIKSAMVGINTRLAAIEAKLAENFVFSGNNYQLNDMQSFADELSEIFEGISNDISVINGDIVEIRNILANAADNITITYRGVDYTLAEFLLFLAGEQDSQDNTLANHEVRISALEAGGGGEPIDDRSAVYRDQSYEDLNGAFSAVATEQDAQDNAHGVLSQTVTEHINNKSNPHDVTADQIPTNDEISVQQWMNNFKGTTDNIFVRLFNIDTKNDQQDDEIESLKNAISGVDADISGILSRLVDAETNIQSLNSVTWTYERG